MQTNRAVCLEMRTAATCMLTQRDRMRGGIVDVSPSCVNRILRCRVKRTASGEGGRIGATRLNTTAAPGWCSARRVCPSVAAAQVIRSGRCLQCIASATSVRRIGWIKIGSSLFR